MCFFFFIITSHETFCHFWRHMSPVNLPKQTLSQSKCDSVVLYFMESPSGSRVRILSSRVRQSSLLQSSTHTHTPVSIGQHSNPEVTTSGQLPGTLLTPRAPEMLLLPFILQQVMEKTPAPPSSEDNRHKSRCEGDNYCIASSSEVTFRASGENCCWTSEL